MSGIPMRGRPHVKIQGGRYVPSREAIEGGMQGIESEFLQSQETVNVVVRCRVCSGDFGLSLDAEGAVAWQRGALIQEALPTLSVADRELLISGHCGPCFDDLFTFGEDDE